jgi:hypothetical protein
LYCIAEDIIELCPKNEYSSFGIRAPYSDKVIVVLVSPTILFNLLDTVTLPDFVSRDVKVPLGPSQEKVL